jgi:hypothetical protein
MPLENVAPSRPTVELHINLWRDSGLDADFADIGIKLEQANHLQRLMMFFPVQLEKSQILDLSSVMRHQQTLNAVFNDVVDIVENDERWFDTEVRGTPFTRVHPFSVKSDMELRPESMETDEVGTVLSFNQSFCQRFHDACSHYVRFRIYLTPATKNLFSSDIVPGDWWALSSSPNTELTEFRLNERRTMPQAVNKRFDKGPLNIAAIHYFLIRDLRHELLLQHHDFRKIRMLEEHLWRHYLEGRHPVSKEDMQPYRKLQKNRLAIYQWRETATADADGGPKYIQNFNAFAKFKINRLNLFIFVVAFGVIGGLGSAVFNLILEFWRRFGAKPGDPADVGVFDAAVAFGIVGGLCVALVVALIKSKGLSIIPFGSVFVRPQRKNRGAD